MLIDWFTVGAQALNFLILMWLMKRFLYKPIRHAIDERETKIAAELADAEAKKTEARRERDEFQRKNEELDQKRAGLLSQAADEAKAERERLFAQAREAADAMSAKRAEALRNDAQNLNHAIGQRAQQEVFAIARKALNDLATTSLEACLGEVFTRRLGELDLAAKQKLAEALETAAEPALIRSTFELPSEQRAAIQKALNEAVSADVRLRFDTAPDLVSGIELTTNGQKVAWSIADYLVSLEKSVSALLQEEHQRATKTEVRSDLTAKIADRAYELYEQGGRKDDAASHDWSQAEQEIRTLAAATEPKPEAEVKRKPQANAETESDGPMPAADGA